MDAHTPAALIHFPYIETIDDRVSYANDAFLQLSEYQREELHDITIGEVGKLLRLPKDISSFSSTESEESFFMFTKSLEPVEVAVQVQDDIAPQKRIILFRVRQESRIQDKFPYICQLCSENFMGAAIYSVPDYILLKTNQYYLQFLPPPVYSIGDYIGKRVSDIHSGWSGGDAEKIWRDVTRENKSFHAKEYPFDHPERRVTYWDCIITPISEAGEVRYLVMTSNDVTDRVLQRKQIEAQAKVIKKQKEQLEVIVDTVSDDLGIVDHRGTYISLSKGAREYSSSDSYTRAAETSDSTVLFFDDTGKQLSREELPEHRVLRGESLCHFKLTMQRGQEKRYFRINTSPVYDEAGRFMMGVISSSDITDSVHQGQTIMDQNNQLEALFENMSDAIFIIDRNGKYIKMNRAARDHSFPPFDPIGEVGDGRKQAEYLDSSGKPIPWEDAPSRRLIRGEKFTAYQMKVNLSHGRSMDIEMSGSPVYDNSGNFITGIICSRDITDKVKRERVIEKQRDYLFGIVDTFNLPIVRLTYPDFKIIEMNRKAVEYISSLDSIHVPEKEKVGPGAFIEEIFPQFDHPANYALIQQMIQTKSSVYMDDLEFYRHGRKGHFKIIYQPVLDARGDLNEFLITGIDMTSEIVQREELKNIIRLKDEFIATVSHEFKTPLAVINAAVQALETLCKHELSDKAKGFIRSIHQNSLRQLRLVNNLLDLTRLDSGVVRMEKRNLDIVLLTRLITDSVQLYAKQKGVFLQFSSILPCTRIAMDEEKYERILLNLLSNAIKFTPRNKCIVVTVSKRNGHIIVKVKDEGVGIPKDKQSLIFERFGQVDSSLTRENEGTGIGLSLVKSLVEALDGSISVRSQIKKGSVFTLAFPIITLPSAKLKPGKENFTDSHLVYSTAVELSDIYFD